MRTPATLTRRRALEGLAAFAALGAALEARPLLAMGAPSTEAATPAQEANMAIATAPARNPGPANQGGFYVVFGDYLTLARRYVVRGDTPAAALTRVREKLHPLFARVCPEAEEVVRLMPIDGLRVLDVVARERGLAGGFRDLTAGEDPATLAVFDRAIELCGKWATLATTESQAAIA